MDSAQQAVDREWVRLEKLRPSEIPAHPRLASYQVVRIEMDPCELAKKVIREGELFMQDYLRSSKKIGQKQSPPASAFVDLSSMIFKPCELHSRRDGGKRETEAWFGRHSTHIDMSGPGTANWQELESVLFYDRNNNEARYTPAVVDAYEICNWNDKTSKMDRETTMGVWEMYHKLPVLKNRRFMVLAVTGRLSKDAYITVKLPIENIPDVQRHNSAVSGRYVSIERLERDGSQIKWDMTTSSNAGGWIPNILQRKQIPGEIAKDVGFVINYVGEKGKTIGSKEDGDNAAA